MRGHLYLSGIKHSGKTTLAALIAPALDMPWVDLDALVLTTIGAFPSIRSFYREMGQIAFQAKEVEALEALLSEASAPHLIALGGGACDNEDLMTLVKGSGTLIYLQVDEEVLYRRIMGAGIPPFLDGPDPRHAFSLLYQRRHERYSQACDLLVELSDGPADEQAETVLLALEGQEV